MVSELGHPELLTHADCLPDNTAHNDTPASIPNRISGNIPISLHTQIIQPGSDVEIPIVTTSLRSGPTSLLALVIFSNAEDEDDVVTLRLSQSVTVQPLASLTTSVSAAKGDPQKYLLCLEVRCHN